MHPSSCVEEAKGQATLIGLQALSTVYRGQLTLEMDCMGIANELMPGKPNRSSQYPIISDIQRELNKFAAYSITTVSRKGNLLAHELAAKARQKEEQTMIADVPQDLCPLMLSEYSV